MAHTHDIAVFICRAQPVHDGHLSVILQAFEHAKYVVILVGSSGAPRSYRNPWTFEERLTMLHNSVPGHLRNRLSIKPLEDAAYNDHKWISQVQNSVMRAAWEFGYTNEPTVALIGHSKDSSSYYLKLFPQWDNIEVANHMGLNSTDIRNQYFVPNLSQLPKELTEGSMPVSIVGFLNKFLNSKDFAYIVNEYQFVNKYKLSWAAAPYPVNLVCVDAVVIKSGHVLMIERGALPGKGLMALPGGYLNVNERAIDGMIRELREETRLKVPEAVLRGSIVAHDIFDDPNRSSRGRVMTIAYLIDLGTGPLDRVKGGDDAKQAQWVPLANVKREKTFEDHLDIIQFLTGT